MAGLFVVIVGIAWELSPRDFARPLSATGTVRSLRKTWPADSKYAGIVRLPFAEIDVAMPDGRVVRLRGDIRLMQQCRVGGPIRVVGMPTNSGLALWGLARDPCV